jgi:hypothetical protein
MLILSSYKSQGFPLLGTCVISVRSITTEVTVPQAYPLVLLMQFVNRDIFLHKFK